MPFPRFVASLTSCPVNHISLRLIILRVLSTPLTTPDVSGTVLAAVDHGMRTA